MCVCVCDSHASCTSHNRHDGLIILATNCPYDLDEAMHRRIMLAIEFRQPDHLLRKAIWKCHIPEQMKVADDIDMVRVGDEEWVSEVRGSEAGVRCLCGCD